MSWLALTRGWGDLLRPRILGLLLTGIALTLGLFVALQAGLVLLLRAVVPGALTLPFIGAVDLGNTLGWASLALFPVMGFFLMAPVAAAFSGLFTERVAETVEAIHYPGLHAEPPDIWDSVLESLPLIGAVIGVAIASLLLTPLLGPFAPVLFYGANGWLLGREFFQAAARRHLPEAEATALRRANSVTVTWTGVMIAFLLTIPLVNIAVPMLAAASFTHLFHRISGPRRPALQYPRG